MGANTSRLPYTEIFERVKDLVRDNSTTSAAEDKYKGMVNDIYVNELPQATDIEFMHTSSAFVTGDDYTTGTVSIDTGSTAVTGSGTAWTASYNEYDFKIDSIGEVYSFSKQTSTTGVLGFPYSGDSISAASYTLFKERYPLAEDFGDFIDGDKHSLYYYTTGATSPTYLEGLTDTGWKDEYSTTPADPRYYKHSHSTDILTGVEQVEITPPPNDDRWIYYEYVQRLDNMTEYTTGTCSAATGDATISGTGTTFVGNVDIDNNVYYFRFDDDGTGASSVWYKIDTVENASTVTITPSYAGAVKADVNYTIAQVSKLPAQLDLYILYKACANGIANQSDNVFQYYFALADGVLKKFIGRQARRVPYRRMKTIYETSPNARK